MRTTTLACLLLLPLLAACGDSPTTGPGPAHVVVDGTALGVAVTLTVDSDDRPKARAAADAALAEIARLEAIFDTANPKSELMRLSARAGGEPVPVSRDLWDALSRALDLARRSRGAYDPTLPPFAALWAQAHAAGVLPDEAEAAKTRPLVGHEQVELHPPTRAVLLGRKGMQLDLGAYARGFLAQAAWAVLGMKGMPRCLVQVGPVWMAGEAPQGEQGWHIELPGGDAFLIAGVAAAVSAAEPAFVDIGGTRYAARLDPRSGRGLTEPAQAFVVAIDGPLAGMLADTAVVWGVDEGAAWVEQVPGAEARVTSTDGTSTRDTPGFLAYYRAP